MSDDNIINHPAMLDPQLGKRLVDKIMTHPLEQALDIESGTTIVSVPEARNTLLVDSPTYDEKDKEIEQNYQEVYDKAMDVFDEMQENASDQGPRHQEVAALMLTTALAAAKEKARMKEHKDKLINNASKRDPQTGEKNEVIHMSSSDLIRSLHAEKNSRAAPIEAEIVEVSIEPEPTTTRSTIKRNKPEIEE